MQRQTLLKEARALIYSVALGGILIQPMISHSVSGQDNSVNIAPLVGIATQSSTGSGGDASRAIDGNTDGNFGAGSVTHTSGTDIPFWEVDLNDVYEVDRVVIWNRTDCCGERLTNFEVLALDGAFGVVYSEILYSGEGEFAPESFEVVFPAGTNARWISIQPFEEGILSLAEVEVFSSLAGMPPTLQGTMPPLVLRTVGQALELSVTALGETPLDYTWYKNGVELPEFDGPTLTIDPVLTSTAGDYSVEVSNGLGQAQSGTTTVQVPGYNVALGKSAVSGSGAYNGVAFDAGQFPVSKVTDGNTFEGVNAPISYWLEANGKTDAWFILDLEEPRSIEALALYNTHNRQYNDRGTGSFEIYASDSIEELFASGGVARYYAFEGDLNDASDTVAHGTGLANWLNDSPAAISGSQSLELNGFGDLIEIMDPENPSAYTISLWVRLDEIRAGSLITRTDANGSGASWSHQLRVTAAGNVEHYVWDGAVKTVTSSTTLEAGIWYHIAGTAENGGSLKLYINGTEEGTAVTVSALWGGGDRWWIGSDSGAARDTFPLGALDDLAIWHGDLGADGIAELSSGQSPNATALPDAPSLGQRLVNPQMILSGFLTDTTDLAELPVDFFDPQSGLTPTTARYLQFQATSANNPGNHVGLNEIVVISDLETPEQGDTHLTDLTTVGDPVADVSGSATLTFNATANDESGDPIYYTYQLESSTGQILQQGPALDLTSATFEIPVGSWTLTVTVDDDLILIDAAEDNQRIESIEIQPFGSLVLISEGSPVIDGSGAYNGVAFNEGTFPASNITDGNINEATDAPVSYWLERDGSGSGWALIDLGEPQPINAIRLYNTHNRQYADRGTGDFQILAGNQLDQIFAEGGVTRFYGFENNVEDGSGNGIHGAVTGTLNYTSDVPAAVQSGSAGIFAGADTQVEILDSEAYRAYTLSAWVRPDGLEGGSIIARTNASGITAAWSHQLRINDFGNFEHYLFDGAAKQVTSFTFTSPGQWYHVVGAVSNSGEMRLYVNGVEEGTPVVINNLWSGGDRWTLGGQSGQISAPFSGAIAEVAIWDHDRFSTSEIEELNSGLSPLELAPADAGDPALVLSDAEVILSGTLSSTIGQDFINPDTFNTDNGLSPVIARYVRVELLSANNGGNHVGLNEIEILSDPTFTGEVDQPVLNIERSGNSLILTWEGDFQLMEASAATGPYEVVENAVSGVAVSTEAPQSFYRLRKE